MRMKIEGAGQSPTTTKFLFPTLLHIREEFLTETSLDNLSKLAEDKAYVESESLNRAVIEFALGALRQQGADLTNFSAIELSEIWFNVLEAGEHHWDHTHANHILSGILYLTEDCFTIFGDPRPAAAVLPLSYKEPSEGQVRSYVHKGMRNSAVLFPSWLPHRVATTASRRKTIAFNLMLRGRFGGDHSREQIVL